MGPMKPTDNSVNERRLRPVYDYLDHGNNKKALQEADRVLKKQSNLQCARALKALALVRLGRAEEAHQHLLEVHAEEPCDDATLQAMAICYRETHRPELTCQAYEAAVKKDPSNEEFLSHLFMAHVRVGDYRKQQQTAMALYKAKAKNPYYFWAVMSILMQAHGSEDKLCLTVTLPLAERMIKKFVDDNKIEAEAEVQLYLMILEQQKKYQEALDVLQGPLSSKLAATTVVAKKGDYLRHLEQWSQLLDYYEDLLRLNPDEWSHYVRYVEAVFQQPTDRSIERAKTFILSIASDEYSKTDQQVKVRGPFLARLYFWQQLDKNKFDAIALFGDFCQFTEEYVKLFGDKPCAFQDLRPFIQSIPDAQVTDLLACTERLINLKDGESPTSVKQICRHLLHIQLSRYLGRHERLCTQEKVSLADRLWTHYQETKFLNAGLLSTDFRPNDGYALLASQLLLDTWNQDPRVLEKCLFVLETALHHSPANYHLKLLTSRVYTLAGQGRAALQRYETLDVKYIQLDSLGHLLCRPLISMGLPLSASSLLNATLRFYTSHAKETSECLISAYKYGSFDKIPEFTRFGRRLDGSHHFAASTPERMLLDLMLSTDGVGAGAAQSKLVQTASGMFADPDKDQPNWNIEGPDALVDNRDCALFVSWDPPSRQIGEEIVRATFKGEVQFARLRNRLVHALVAVTSLSPLWPDGEESAKSIVTANSNGTTAGLGDGKSPIAILQRLLEELRTLSLQLKEESFISHSQFSVQSPPPPRLYTYVADQCLEPLLTVMDVVVEAAGASPSGAENAVQRFKLAMNRLIAAAQRPTCVETEGLWRNYVRLERIYNAVETLCLCSLVISTLHSIVKASANSRKKKGKTKEATQLSSNQMADQLAGLVECATSTVRALEPIVDQLAVEASFSLLQVADGGQREVSANDDISAPILQDTRKKLSVFPGTEMKSLLAEKRKLLESCHT